MADEEQVKPWSTNSVIITVVVTIGLAVLAAFWQLSDPRNDIRTIRDTYLTVREHAEFEIRVARDITRLEDENKRQISREEYNTHAEQNARTTEALRREIEELRTELLQHERDDRGLGPALGSPFGPTNNTRPR